MEHPSPDTTRTLACVPSLGQLHPGDRDLSAVDGFSERGLHGHFAAAVIGATVDVLIDFDVDVGVGVGGRYGPRAALLSACPAASEEDQNSGVVHRVVDPAHLVGPLVMLLAVGGSGA